MAIDEAHAEAYTEFLKRSTVQKTAKDWIDKELRSCLNNSIAIIRADIIDVLSVGAGEGELDLNILNVLAKCVSRRGKVRYTVLEPNKTALDKFRNNIFSLSDEIQSVVEFSWYQTTFEIFASMQNVKKYHFIHFLHSLQFLDGEKVLKQSYDTFLEEDGVLLAMVESEKSCSHKIFRKFSVHADKLTQNPDFKIEPLTSIESLKAFAVKSKWSYKSFSRGFTIDLTECFKESSPSGDLMLNFLFRVQDLRRLASSALMEEIIEFLSEECKKGEKGGSFAMGGLGGIVIHKNKYLIRTI